MVGIDIFNKKNWWAMQKLLHLHYKLNEYGEKRNIV